MRSGATEPQLSASYLSQRLMIIINRVRDSGDGALCCAHQDAGAGSRAGGGEVSTARVLRAARRIFQTNHPAGLIDMNIYQMNLRSRAFGLFSRHSLSQRLVTSACVKLRL